MSQLGFDNSQYHPSSPNNDYFGAPFDHHTSFDGMNFGAAEEHGTPVVGIYAQDGIWDEEDSDVRTVSTATAKASGSEAASTYGDRSLSSRVGSYRSRSNTIIGPKDEEKQSGGWNWGRRPTAAGIASTAVPDIAPVPKLKEKKSKSMLRGKGRKGELSVMVSAENQRGAVSLDLRPCVTFLICSYLHHRCPAPRKLSWKAPLLSPPDPECRPTKTSGPTRAPPTLWDQPKANHHGRKA